MLEVFAGSAGLTRAFGAARLLGVAIDHAERAHLPNDFYVVLDLQDKRAQDDLRKFVRHPDVRHVHFAPPCGTASRARDRPLTKSLRAAGVFEPPPARSDEFPLGLPDLARQHPKLAVRVAAANELYDYTASVCELLSGLGRSWAIENPSNSYMWLAPGMQRLLAAGALDVHFDLCMHGGKRKKATCLRCSVSSPLSALSAQCDGKHAHEPWSYDRGFATAEEAAYPEQLCQTYAQLLSASLPPRTPLLSDDVRALRLIAAADRVGAAIHRLGIRSLSLLPELRSWLRTT